MKNFAFLIAVFLMAVSLIGFSSCKTSGEASSETTTQLPVVSESKAPENSVQLPVVSESKAPENSIEETVWTKEMVDAVPEAEGLKIFYRVDGYCVEGIGSFEGDVLKIPATYDGQPVTSIAKDAFRENDSIRTLILTENIETVGHYAFGDSHIETLVLDCENTVFEGDTFWNALQLSSVQLVCPPEKLCEGMFSGCTSLASFPFWEGLEEIPKRCFFGSGLAKVRIPTTVKTIGDSAFSQSDVVEVILSEGVETIENSAFSMCESLKSFTFSSTVKKICISAFRWCNALEYLVIPRSVEKIEMMAVWECEQLKAIFCEIEEKPDGWSAPFIAAGKVPFEPVYWGGMWEYNENGIPVPLEEKK